MGDREKEREKKRKDIINLLVNFNRIHRVRQSICVYLLQFVYLMVKKKK